MRLIHLKYISYLTKTHKVNLGVGSCSGSVNILLQFQFNGQIKGILFDALVKNLMMRPIYAKFLKRFVACVKIFEKWERKNVFNFSPPPPFFW